MRYALVALELVNRKPVNFLHIEYSYLHFDVNGQIDVDEQEKEMRLGVDMLPPNLADRPSRKFVDAQHRFAKKRFYDKYKWTPTPELEEAIMKAAWGVEYS